MGANSQSRVIIGLCMDKERDEELLNFLSSKKNKSEYIRKILYENVTGNNATDNLASSSSTALLSDISITLRNILFVLSGLNLPKELDTLVNKTPVQENSDKPTDQIKESTVTEEPKDEDDYILGVVANSFKGF